MKKQTQIEVIEHWLQGERSAEFFITSSRPEDRRRLTNLVNLMEGRFRTLSGEQQAKARWRARALVYVDKKYRENRTLGLASVEGIAANELGCGASSLKKWRKAILNSGLGAGYWHLLLTPKDAKRPGLVRDAPAAWIKMRELLAEGHRPSAIPLMLKEEFGVNISVRAVHRAAKSEEQQGRLTRVKFINRFK